MSDGELVRQALDGRPQAYEESVRRWAGRVTALCHAKLGRADAADDMAQEMPCVVTAACALWRTPKSSALGFVASPSAPASTSSRARRRLRFRSASSARIANRKTFFAAAPTPTCRSRSCADELLQLTAEVEALPETYREVLMLYYYDDVSYRDVAEVLGVSVATVNVRLTKARALLRERFGKRIRK